jgi:hypothetical protein
MNESLAPTDWSKVTDFVEDNSPNARFKGDSKLHVQFYTRPILLSQRSEEEGRPLYTDVTHVRILTPGDKLSIIDRIASQDDKQRFAAQYAKFMQGKGEDVIGTRLEAVPWMTRSKVEEYKFFGILTVEQLAEANDQVGQKFPGFHADRIRSKEFLEATTGTNARVAALEKQIADLLAKEAASETE